MKSHSLDEYTQKRNFKSTAEPAPPQAKLKKTALKLTHPLKFVVHEHHASHLHYDFRLEADGVLKSWAVPKGPSADPTQKRLAVQVEDHPFDYGNFEGEIPEDEYGGGEVLIWDSGIWTPEGDLHQGLKKGRLDFSLQGKRMKGRWSLIRLRTSGSKPNWLLFKRNDEFAGIDKDFHPIKDYGSKHERKLKNKKQTALPLPQPVRGKKISKKKEAMPEFIEPELPLLVEKPPAESGEWLHEVKFDGYRIQTHFKKKGITLFTRSHQDWTHKYEGILKSLQKMKVKDTILDGEVVVLDEHQRSDFQALQMAMKTNRPQSIFYYVFDLLFLNKHDLREQPLVERKKLLKQLIETFPSPNILYSEHLKTSGDQFFGSSCHENLEGIVSKKIDSPYESGRTRQWVKSKCGKRQEFVIGGFTEPQGKREYLGALLLGVYEGGKLRFVGKCGTGFNQTNLPVIYKKLKSIETSQSPFDLKSPHGAEIHWVKPQAAAEVSFSMWTRDEILRVPVFQGLREDKPVKEIKREVAEKKPGKAKNDLLKKDKKTTPAQVKKSNAEPTLTHPDKIIFAKEKITKQQIVDFYQLAAPSLLPQITNRPLSLNRCPNGTSAPCFFQKHLEHAEPPLHPVEITEKSGKKEYVTVDSMEGVNALVQKGGFEIHAWGCRAPDVEHADQIVMDFDPDEGLAFERVKEAAMTLKETLARLKMKCFLKVTGGKGLHVHIPIATDHTWDEVKSFSKALADEMVSRFPKLYTSTLSKDARKGKIFVDYLRNGRSSTAVIPYSLRARPTSSVALPIEWEELKKLKSPSQFTLKAATEHLKRRKKDPWKGMEKIKQKIMILS